MPVIAKKQQIFVFFLLAILLLSCERNNSGLIDGYYSAQVAEFDAHGWKEYLTICVSGGSIILVEYNAVNPSGFVKSWDMDYMREMNAVNGTYPNAYTRHYGSLFLDAQEVDGIDALSGASHSHPVFIALAKEVLKNAGAGNSKTSLVYIEEED